MFEVTYKLTDFFFDRLAVQDLISRKERRAMSKIGSYVRRGARSSLRPGKRPSNPGDPPRVHTKSRTASIKNILFGYDPSKHSVVIGPVRLRRRQSKGFYLTSKGGRGRDSKGRFTSKAKYGAWISDIKNDKPVSSLMEFGGSLRAKVNNEDRTLHYSPRPFMKPALDREANNGKLIQAWKALS